MTYYLNATEARSHARSNLTIFDEVNAVMRAIIVASDAGDYSITINNTTLTQSTDHFAAWVGTTTDYKRDDEISEVIRYFRNRGYNITQRNDGTTFSWVIYW